MIYNTMRKHYIFVVSKENELQKCSSLYVTNIKIYFIKVFSVLTKVSMLKLMHRITYYTKQSNFSPLL